MKARMRLLVILISVFSHTTAYAAEISVAPGSGTLAAAIANASDGDILLLGDGTYGGAATIDKSLTVRARSRATDAVVADILTVDGPDIAVTVQGLHFTAEINVDRGASVRILENAWNTGGIDVSDYSTDEGDGDLIVIGNRVANGEIRSIASQNSYIAGNEVTASSGNTGIYASVSAWVVGNKVRSASAAINIGSSSAVSRIIGNRVFCAAYSLNCCICSPGISLVANNIVEVAAALNRESTGIAASGASFPTVVNNLVRGVPPGNVGSAIVIRTTSGRVSGNIIVDFPVYGAIEGAGSTSSYADASYNLCYGEDTNCPAGNGNLSVDPLFVDMADYRLAANSPAIDHGDPDPTFADLDRTRNDMGVYGGPWSR